jgi:NAD(P)-dependent dehydrogenase (short-subunit alcohol dehydrogenase family)
MLLENRNAVVYGAGGAIGSGVARTFAREGARVFLVGRTAKTLDEVAADITAAGGYAEVAVLDVLDERAVDEHAASIVSRHGTLDVSFNLVTRGDVQGIPLVDMSVADFVRPVTTGLTANFITARAAARHMVRQHSGVILFVTAVPALGGANVTAIGSAFGAMESLLRCLATDLGPAGVRVVGIRSGGMVDTRTIQQSAESVAQTLGVSKEQVLSTFAQRALLKRLSTVADTARVAAFLASDGARPLTGAIVNASNGSFID